MAKRKKKSAGRLTDTVREHIRTDIISRLKPGDVLPSQPELCARFEVGAGTVAKAVKDLETEGLVIRFRGSGVYAADPEAPAVAICNVGFPEEETADLILARSAVEDRMRFVNFDTLPGYAELLKANIRGIVFLQSVAERSYLEDLTSHGIHVVVMDWTYDVPGVDSINIDSFRAGELATEVLLEAGHNRIAYVGMQPFDEEEKRFTAEPDCEKQNAGYRTALMKNNIAYDPGLVARLRYPSPYEKRPDFYSSEQICNQVFGLPDPPTALIVFNMNAVGMSLRSMMANRGITIPGDVSIITLGTLEGSKGLSVVGTEAALLLKTALQRIKARLSEEMPPEHQRILVGVKYAGNRSVRRLG